MTARSFALASAHLYYKGGPRIAIVENEYRFPRFDPSLTGDELERFVLDILSKVSYSAGGFPVTGAKVRIGDNSAAIIGDGFSVKWVDFGYVDRLPGESDEDWAGRVVKGDGKFAVHDFSHRTVTAPISHEGWLRGWAT